MTLNDVLALAMEQKSIKKIDMFLAENKQISYEYNKALSYKCLILHSLERDKDALRLLLTQTPLFENMDSKGVVAICDVIIDIFIEARQQDQALKYIDIKRDHLPTIDSEAYLYDMIRFHSMSGNKSELKRNIILYLEEDIPEDKRIEVLEILLKFQYIDKEYDGFDSTYKRLEGYYIKNFMFDKLSDIKEKRSYNLFVQNKFDELEAFVESYISDDSLSKNLHILGAKYLLEVYLFRGENRKAMILESEYHDLYTFASYEVQLEFVNSAIKVAEAIHNKFNILEYEEIISELEVKIAEEKKALRKSNKKTVNFQIIEEEVVEKVVNETVRIKKETFEESPTMMFEPTLIEVSKSYKSLEAILSTLSTREGIKFREIFRNFGIEIERKFSSCEIVIALEKNGMGYHYKMERVYEKTFDDARIEGSPIEELIKNSRKMYLVDVKSSLFDKNVITNAPYEDTFKSIIGFTLTRNDAVIGAIIYEFKTTDFEDKLIYETLRMLTSMLQIHINKTLDIDDLDKIQRAKNFLFDNQENGIKIEIDHQIELNERARDLLNLKHLKLEDSEYIALIDPKDASNYKEMMREIYNFKANEGVCYYHIGDRYFKEEIKVERQDVTRIYSVISDMTDIKQRESKLIERANISSVSKLKTRDRLYDDLKKIIDSKKFGLAMISVKNYKMFLDIYGYDFAIELTSIMGRELTRQENQDISIYHLESDRFMVLFNKTNDTRAIKSKTEAIIKEIRKNLNTFNYRLKIELKAGVFRYTKAMRILDINKMLVFASEALLDAYDNESDVMVYDSDTVAKRFKESQILLHVSEAIDDRSIAMYYRQVVNIKEQSVDFYMPRLNMQEFDIEEKYFDSVISKREITDMMDKYMLKEALNEMKTFHDISKVYYHIILPIHRSTATSSMFISYLDRYLKFYKIPSETIVIDIINDTDKPITRLRAALADRGIMLASTSFDFVVTEALSYFICDFKKYGLDASRALLAACNNLVVDLIAANITTKSEMVLVTDMGAKYLCDNHNQFLISDLIKFSSEEE